MNEIPGTTESAAGKSPPVPLTMDALIRFSLIVLLAVWCFEIVSPFLIPAIWGLIIAVALFPVYSKIRAVLGGQGSLAAILLGGIMIAALVVPSVMMGNSAVKGLHDPIQELKAGTYQLPELPEKAGSLPIVGKPLLNLWKQSKDDLAGTLSQYKDQIRNIAAWAGNTLGSTVGGILYSIFSIAIAAIFWLNAEVLLRGCNHIAVRLFGDDGADYIKLSGLTIQSVAQGVIGVALIQAILAGIGLFAVGAPMPGVWMLLVMVVAVAQLPPILVLGPVAAYMFTIETTTVATAFLVWSIVVSFSDTFLKPLLLGRGLDIPMIVILVGAIGGMIMHGILGLFVGAVVLGMTYELTKKWTLVK